MTGQSDEEPQGLDSGSMEFMFRTPDKGRVNLNLFSKNGDDLLHVSLRFDWNNWKKILVLNSRNVGQHWGKEAYPKGFTFEANKTVHVGIEITTKGYHVSANHKKIGEYTGILLPVDMASYYFEDTGASIKAKLISFKVYQ